jgi:hypothetical protein
MPPVRNETELVIWLGIELGVAFVAALVVDSLRRWWDNRR